MYGYDYFGWYIGESNSDRATGIKPDNESTSDSEGDLRSNWTGYRWIELPYKQNNEAEIEVNLSKINKLKEEKLNELSIKFKDEAHKPVNFLTNTFNGGLESAQIAKGKSDMVIRFKLNDEDVPPYALTFNDINNNPILFDTDSLQDLAVALGMAYENNFQKKAAIKRKINAMTTLEEIQGCDIEAEWRGK